MFYASTNCRLDGIALFGCFAKRVITWPLFMDTTFKAPKGSADSQNTDLNRRSPPKINHRDFQDLRALKASDCHEYWCMSRQSAWWNHVQHRYRCYFFYPSVHLDPSAAVDLSFLLIHLASDKTWCHCFLLWYCVIFGTRTSVASMICPPRASRPWSLRYSSNIPKSSSITLALRRRSLKKLL